MTHIIFYSRVKIKSFVAKGREETADLCSAVVSVWCLLPAVMVPVESLGTQVWLTDVAVSGATGAG